MDRDWGTQDVLELNWAGLQGDPSSLSYSSTYGINAHRVPGPLVGAEQNREPLHPCPPRVERLETCINEYTSWQNAKCSADTTQERPPGVGVTREDLSEEGNFRLWPET